MNVVSAELPELVIRHQPGALGAPAPDSELQTWRDNDGRLVARGGRDGAAWWMHWPGLATFLFSHAGPVVAHTAAHGLEAVIADVFARGVVPVVLLARGFEGLHASALMLDDGSVVGLCATSGTGKSTLAVAMTACGVRHFADDTVVYRVLEGRPMALRLPSPIRIDAPARHAAMASVIPESAVVPPGTAGPLLRIYALSRDASIDPDVPRFSPIPTARRFETLLTHAHPFDMGSEQRQRAFIEHLLAVARHTEVWQCRFAPSLECLPQLATALCDHART